ncbi:AmmeMemoRadiSam system radical SAM enzyme [Candidatus Woesearchaeota archaeon]|nr:AmmeMemoRadiSam system radical SAM enzyme [Candidatus Woesearchaeota archaeon]
MGEEENNPAEKLLNKKISRREFLKYSFIGIGGLATAAYGYNHLFGRSSGSLPDIFPASAPDELWKWSKEALYYKQVGENVQCELCPHECSLAPDDRGICRTRVNKEGKLYSLAYGNPCSAHVDPIEKKPLFHFLPSSSIFSIATAGCNLRCLNCQNWQISQFQPEETNNFDLMPGNVVRAAVQNNCKSIAYTYSEPIIFYEYMYDTSRIARAQGLKNVMVTAGYINEKPFRDLCKVIDAANIDLKGISEKTYNELNGATLEPVLDCLKIAKEEKLWFEITNLVVPTWTDNLDMIRDMCQWLHKNGFDEHPVHFSRFSPMYKLTHLPPTPVNLLGEARKVAMDEGLKYVYIGNVPGTDAENTYCPKCGKVVIGRRGYIITENNLSNGSCRFCGYKIAGVFQE